VWSWWFGSRSREAGANGGREKGFHTSKIRLGECTRGGGGWDTIFRFRSRLEKIPSLKGYYLSPIRRLSENSTMKKGQGTKIGGGGRSETLILGWGERR